MTGVGDGDGAIEFPRWTLPEPLAVFEVRAPDGALLFVRRHGDPEGPRIVFCHGNGFSADACFPFWSHFIDRFDVFVHDVRNHGRSPLGNRRAHNVPTFADDSECVVCAIDQRFGRKPRAGVFHSLSAIVALRQAATTGGGFAALVLFDPPVCPPGGFPEDLLGIGERMSRIDRRLRGVPGTESGIPAPAPRHARSPGPNDAAPLDFRRGLHALLPARVRGPGQRVFLRVVDGGRLRQRCVSGEGNRRRPDSSRDVHAEHGPRGAWSRRLRLRAGCLPFAPVRGTGAMRRADARVSRTAGVDMTRRGDGQTGELRRVEASRRPSGSMPTLPARAPASPRQDCGRRFGDIAGGLVTNAGRPREDRFRTAACAELDDT